ncbi:MAG: NAD(P)-dependent oxidoreductase [Gammaproteobacteria bacterium]|jgi:3-hydroxyisobutyrate dehydrogenase-like beta-hydroxyacid dehydrogenase
MQIRLGFLGLGKMGAGMAARLLDTGHTVTVWNRTAARTEALEAAGAEVATVPADVVTRSELIISMLHDDQAAYDVYSGTNGLLSVPAGEKLFIDMSTLRPEAARDLAERCSAKGAAFIDAPVSGTVGPARTGRLMALVGGSEANLERARPTLEALTRRIVHAGPVGNGSLLKLVLNLPLAVYWQSLAEALALGHSGGLALDTMLDAVSDSGGALSALSHKISMIIDDSADVAFDIATMEKDARAILAVGAEFGIQMPTTTAALTAYSSAHAAGLGSADAVAIIRYLLDSLDPSDIEQSPP